LHKNVGKRFLVQSDLPKLELLNKNVGKRFLVPSDLPTLGLLNKNVGKTALIYPLISVISSKSINKGEQLSQIWMPESESFCAKVPMLSYFVEPKHPSGNC
jgi:hypothetical protein